LLNKHNRKVCFLLFSNTIKGIQYRWRRHAFETTQKPMWRYHPILIHNSDRGYDMSVIWGVFNARWVSC